jgi:hypothetical protein
MAVPPLPCDSKKKQLHVQAADTEFRDDRMDSSSFPFNLSNLQANMAKKNRTVKEKHGFPRRFRLKAKLNVYHAI